MPVSNAQLAIIADRVWPWRASRSETSMTRSKPASAFKQRFMAFGHHPSGGPIRGCRPVYARFGRSCTLAGGRRELVPAGIGPGLSAQRRARPAPIVLHHSGVHFDLVTDIDYGNFELELE